MSTKYKLLKDLPDCKAGTILTLSGHANDLYMYAGIFDDGQEASWYLKATVENNPEWFELVEERIEVLDLQQIKQYPLNYNFSVSKPIPEDKLPLIKEAISKWLNEVEEDNFNWNNCNKGEFKCDASCATTGCKNWEAWKQRHPQPLAVPEKIFTLEQLNEERRKAFNAGRAMYRIQIPNNGKQYGDFEFHHPTFEDYLKSIQ